MTLNQNYQIAPTVEPSNATDKSLTYESDDTDVVSVDNDGEVTALTEGTAVVTVKSVSNGNVQTEIDFTVEELFVDVDDVTLDKENLTMEVEDTEQLTATVEPSGATNKDLTWTSDDEDIATVDSNGLVTAVSDGTAFITVTSDSNENAYAEAEVTVEEPEVDVTDVTINETELTLSVTDTEQLVATVEPSNATNTNLSWSSSDDGIVTVDSNGLVTAVSEGTATITVTSDADNSKKTECVVTVE